jgi:Zn-dependent protease
VLGRIKGAPVVMTGSCFLIIAAAAVYFSISFDRSAWRSTQESVIIGASMALSLVVSVFLHELAHGLAGHAMGEPPTEYVLTFWGGHTSFRSLMPRPGVEAVISGAGPAVNLLLAAAFWGLYQTIDSPLSIASTVTFYVAWVNLVLGIFNALPAPPLDGGAVLEAAVWRVTGSRSKGAAAAGWCGLVVGAALAIYGIAASRFGSWRASDAMIFLLLGLIVAQGSWSAIGRSRRWRSLTTARVEDLVVPAVTLPAQAWSSDIDSFRTGATAAPAVVVVDGHGAALGYVDPRAEAMTRGSVHPVHLDAIMIALPPGLALPLDGDRLELARNVFALAERLAYVPVTRSGQIVGLLPVAQAAREFEGAR